MVNPQVAKQEGPDSNDDKGVTFHLINLSAQRTNKKESLRMSSSEKKQK